MRRGRGSGLGVGVGVPEGVAGLGVWGGVGGWSWGSRLAGEGTAMELGVPVAEEGDRGTRAQGELAQGQRAELGGAEGRGGVRLLSESFRGLSGEMES